MPNIYVNSNNKKNIAYLIFERKKIRCLIGKNGIGRKNREGDLKTPKGVYRIRRIHYRKDKFLNLKSGIPIFKLKRNDKWCVDPKSKRYNSYFRKNINLVSKIGGCVLLITGVLILTNQLQTLGYYILNTFPFLQNFG